MKINKCIYRYYIFVVNLLFINLKHDLNHDFVVVDLNQIQLAYFFCGVPF